MSLTRQLWEKTELEGGKIEFFNERLGDFQDLSAEKDNNVAILLLTLPNQCSELIEKRQPLDLSACEHIRNQIQNHDFFDHARELSSMESEESRFKDWRHSLAGMLAVIVCLGEEWLYSDPSRSAFVDAEFLKILNDPPKVTAYTAEDSHTDFECFLARIAARRWASNVNDPDWREAVARLVTSYRYRTVQSLFDEAFRCRAKLGNAYIELEAFALSFSCVRQRATESNFLGKRDTEDELMSVWAREWIPKFSDGEGPQWIDDWASIEANEETTKTDHGNRRVERTKLSQKIRTV